MGFFTGTEPDPIVPNSRCVLYFPTLQAQAILVWSQLNFTALFPGNAIRILDDTFTLINRYSQWQTYCQFGTLFTKLDNTIETFEGITTAFYRMVMNYAAVLVKLGDFTTNMQAGKCFLMARAVGEIFKIVFDFKVPEDVI